MRGVLVHQAHLLDDEVIRVRGVPVTTVARTVFDLAAVLPVHLVERAIDEAEFRGLLKPQSVAALLERYCGCRGIQAIRSVLEARGIGAGVVRSELEARFRALVRGAGLGRPRWNVTMLIDGAWIQPDCVWHDQRVIVELDGRSAHARATAFERDRTRDRLLTVHGWRVVRITWAQLDREPQAVEADLGRILS